MRIVLVGKFPPIQGGVSARTYRIAHGLARRGHEVHVVTNAREVEPGYRVDMRDEDWERCEAIYPSGGRVAVHWTALTREHAHVPAGPSFVTRLASTAITVAREIRAECIFSFYLEPYGVAGHLAASITGTPHLVKMAGSDRGRLWLQQDMRPLYDAVLQRASAVFTSGPLARRLEAAGVPPERQQPISPVMMPTGEFHPEGETFDVALPRPLLGLYGKLHPHKGTSVLIRALRELRGRGFPASVLMMSGGDSASTGRFEAEVEELGLGDAVVRLPFVPPWRVPAFLRTCDIVCSLEHDFPVRGHAPAIFAEGMATGRCVVASTEVALKQPRAERLIHGYNCFLVQDANDPRAVAAALEQALGADREAIGRRARRFAEEAYTASEVLDDVERGLRRAAGEKIPEARETEVESMRGTILRLVRAAGGPGREEEPSSNWFVARLQSSAPPPDPAARDALRFGAQLSESFSPEKRLALFLRSADGQRPAVCAQVTIEEYAHDFQEWLRNAELPLPRPGSCTVAVIPGMPPRVVFVDAELAAVLRDWAPRESVQRWFEEGLLELR